ncbi:MAG: amidohydrolase family protein [Flavobacteriaceae bacterium]
MKKWILMLLSPLTIVMGQDYFPTNTGVKTSELNYQAFIHATVHISPTEVLEDATLLEQNGKIIAVGKNVSIPKNTRIFDKSGLHLYPSFVELNSSFGIATPKRNSSGRSAQYDPSRQGYYWNDHIISDYSSFSDYSYDVKEADALRKAGFGTVNSHRADGIHRGTSTLVVLSDELQDQDRILNIKAAEHFSFQKSVTSNQSYPSSVMGAMALLRQFYYDSRWYEQGNAEQKDLALEAALSQKNLPKIFYADDKLNTLRAAKIGQEMELPFKIVASGQEYELLRELKATNAQLILPLNFPAAYDAEDPLLMKKITLAQLRHWNQAPMNPAEVEKAGISFALTTAKLKSPTTFLSNLRKAVSYGLSEEKALAALTTIPSQWLNQQNTLGVLKKGALSNFIVTSGPLFDNETIIYENWVKGTPHIIQDHTTLSIDGNYTLVAGEETLEIEIKNSLKKIAVTAKKDSLSFKTKSEYKEHWLYLTLIDDKEKEYAQLHAKVVENSVLSGQGINFDGNTINWSATHSQSETKEDKKSKTPSYYDPVPVTFPNKAFGFSTLPTAKNTLFKNATVWTNESEGIIEDADVLVVNGKISKVGKNLISDGAIIIEATGKHLTSGIIDEHSHLGASSINEGGHNSSAEVSIEDVLEPDDIGLYRDLAGGVTAIQILHGSANPIGGRSALIKLKWGASLDELPIKNADPFIKFALGENVKQSNWSSFSRFPQTRMGVEQVFVDYFQRAKEYGQQWDAYNSLSNKLKTQTKKPRYDIEMEVLWQILKGERFISSHSYVQSEINMLMKVAERFNFRINTFTHILEGYKVADKMAEHGVGGSTFSDWWAYKNEVKDAIPYNGAIMHNAGVTVAFNSDDAEMSRRLNQEAGKAVKYGGVSEEDAWKFVTLNPAKLLHLDDRMGSIKVGKDADLVLWSDHPLSIYAKAEKTMIDGVVYYDASKIEAQLQADGQEKQKIISQMLIEKEQGGAIQKAPSPVKREFTCETLE